MITHILKRHFLAFALTMFALSGAFAENKYWQADSGSWNDPANWDSVGVPGSGDAVYIDNGGTATYEGSADYTVGTVNVGVTDSGYWNVSTDGTLYLTYFRAGVNAGSSGEIHLTDGTFQWDGENSIIGQSGKGLLTIDGATAHFTGGYTFYVGLNAGSEGLVVLNGGSFIASRSDGVVNMVIGQQGNGEFVVNNDATLSCGAYVYVGGSQFAGGGTGKLVLNDESNTTIRLLLVGGSMDFPVDSTGILEVNNSAKATFTRLYLGYEANNVGKMYINDNALVSVNEMLVFSYDGTSEIEMNGGTLNANSATYFAYGAGSDSSFDMNGGVFNCRANNVYFGFSGSAEFALNGGEMYARNVYLANNSSASGAISLNGGVLETLSVIGGAGNASLSFDGGTLRAASGAAENFISGISTVSVGAKGAIIDTNSNNITVASAFTGLGGVSKTGQGQLKLSGASSNTGGFNISGGSVLASNLKALGDGTTTIQAGASLDSDVANVSTGGLYINGGTLDAMGDDQAGSYTLSGDFIMDSGVYNLTILDEFTFDQIIGGGSFALNGGTVHLEDFGIEYDKTYQIFDGFLSGEVHEERIFISGYDSVNYVAHISTSGVLWFEAVPEPSAYAAAFGVLALIWALRRRVSR